MRIQVLPHAADSEHPGAGWYVHFSVRSELADVAGPFDDEGEAQDVALRALGPDDELIMFRQPRVAQDASGEVGYRGAA